MKKLTKYMGVCILFCLLASLFMAHKERRVELHEINRVGEQSKMVTFEIDGKEYPILLPLTKPKRTQQESMKLMNRAIKLIKEDQCYLGKNQKANAVTSKLKLEEYYLKGQVQCIWSTNPSGYVNEDGSIQQLRLWSEKKEEQRIELTIRLICDSVEKVLKEQIVIRKVAAQSEEELVSYVNNWIAKTQLDAPTKSRIPLPDEIQGKKVSWKTAESKTMGILLLLGAIACVALVWSDRRSKAQELNKQRERYQTQFPGFVQELSVLLTAGMSVRRCFSLIGETMCKQRKQEFLGKQLLEMVQSIQKGENEIKVYQNFSQKVDVTEYRRLMSLIIQNICKGTYQMSERLGQIAQESYVEQLRQVKIRGEKVSTKLLIPMGILLVMILLVVIVPALFMKI